MASLQGETGRIGRHSTESRRALELLRGSAPARRAWLDPLVLKKELASVYSNLGKWLQLDGKLAEAERVPWARLTTPTSIWPARQRWMNTS